LPELKKLRDLSANEEEDEIGKEHPRPKHKRSLNTRLVYFLVMGELPFTAGILLEERDPKKILMYSIL